MIRWYVIRSKYRNDDLLWQQLFSRNIEAYFPRIRAKTAKSRTPKNKPYFPGYLFVHVDLDSVGTSTLQWIPGAIGLVCFGGEPAYVSDGLLQIIRDRVDQINTVGRELLRDMKSGDDIAIHAGPFAGYHGIFNSYLSDRERVTVLLNFIRDQQIRVELPVEQIKLTKQYRT